MAVLSIDDDLYAELELRAKQRNISLLATLEEMILNYGTLEAAFDDV